jgi:hypothetical protein
MATARAPTIYYGDEAYDGHGDPFNRGAYPWGTKTVSLSPLKGPYAGKA